MGKDKENMEDKTMENLINTLGKIFKKENSEKEIAKLIVDDFYKGDIKKTIKRLYHDIILPVEDKIELMLPKFNYSSLLLNTIMINGYVLKSDLEKEIAKHNKTFCCCADESRTVINSLINLLITGEHSSLQETYSDYWERIKDKEEKERLIDWKNDNRLTYWSCKRFKNTQEVLDWIIDKYYK